MTTKKLARELGLLRQRSQSSAGSKKPLVSNQIFSYLVVIDFESTCWREKNNYSQEIIEFPAVLLNTSTGEIESEFHTYVQPQEHPVLSKFCTELTGITQMQVEAGIPLQICLSRFSRWLQNLQSEMGVVFPNRQQRCSEPSTSQKPCTFLTWSDWDLGVCLQYECKRKQLHKPEVLNSWIDLRSTYRLFYNRKPKGLNGALQDLGIQFSGREHSGLDDSRNTAKLAERMMRDGCVMKITRSLERMSSTVKPLYESTAEDKNKNHNTNNKENTPTASKPLPARIPPTTCQVNSCSEKNNKTKENPNSAQESVQIVKSLISPKTLLNSTTATLLGYDSSKLVKNKASTNLITDSSSPHSRGSNSLVLCATTVGCLSTPQPNQLPETGPTVGFMEEEDVGELLVETEERCGSYDDVLLEGGNDSEHVSAFDSECCEWEEPEYSHSTRDLLLLVENSSKTISRGEMMSKNVSTTSVPSQMRAHVVCTEFAVPKSVPLAFKTNQQKIIPHLHTTSSGLPKNSNTTSPLKTNSFVPGKTSTPNASFVRPKPGITQILKHKQNPKSSFTIYTDPAKQTSAPSISSSRFSLHTSKNVLSSLSTNTVFQSTISKSLPLQLKVGGRITSPLCACGRRAKRQVVSNGGPNQGRGFYCCAVRRSGSGSRIQKGCEFFKWESSLMRGSSAASPAVGSSVSLCPISSALRCRPQQNSTSRKSY